VVVLPIQEAFPFSPEFTENKMTKLDYLTAAKKAIAAITNTKAVKAQRTEAFIEAYSLIPMDSRQTHDDR
jgi:hypothetical protein